VADEKEPLKLLLNLFRKRPDLQDAYPEVSKGNIQALINWAAGVSSNRFKDSENKTLSKFKDWYQKNERPVVRPKNEDIIKEIFNYSKFSPKYCFTSLCEEDSEIVEHLPTLYFLTVEFNLKKTLELGTKDGGSTLVLTEAASKINGYVWSVDVDECFEAKMKISQAGLEKYWTFIQGDDIEIGKNWKESVDHIFIDTSHAYQHTIDEIKLYEPFLKPQGFLTFHDTRSFPGVIKAIRDYLKSIDKKFSFYNYFNNNGFVILRKTG